MKIQFITFSFNGMVQRLCLELDKLNYDVNVVIPITDKQPISET